MQNNPSYSNDVIAVPKSLALLMTFAFILMLVVTFVALVRPVGASPVTQAQVPTTPAVMQLQPVSTTVINLMTTPGHTLGTNANAPLIVEFADFQCPYCRKFAAGAQKGIEQAAQQGKVRFAYKYFAFLGPESFDSAYAAECANRQGKFWEYHDLLTTNWQGENVGSFTVDRLKIFAAQLKIDSSKFNNCLDTQETKSIIDADIAEARNAGVRGTPTFYVNGRLFNTPALDSLTGWSSIWGGQ